MNKKSRADKLKTLLTTLIQTEGSPDLIKSVQVALEQELAEQEAKKVEG